MMIGIIITSHSSGFFLYIFFSLIGSSIDIFSDLGIMLSVFEQPEMDHSKTRDQSMLFSKNIFYVTCVQV